MLVVRLARAVIILYRQHQCGWRVQHYPNRRPGNSHKSFVAGIPASGLAAILFDYNSGTIVFGVGGAVAFNQAPLIVGTAISKTNYTTFTVNANGVYRVSHTLRTALLSLLGSVPVQVNGGRWLVPLVLTGVPLSDQVTVPANAGDTLRLVVSAVALTLAAADNATINIDKIPMTRLLTTNLFVKLRP